jgi:CspA family cold shock protein
MRGIVKWYNDAKEYGFIIPEDNGDDVLVNVNDIVTDGFKTLFEDQHVEFERLIETRGPRAINVRVISK